MIEVAVPPALVIVADSTKLVVPAGASQTEFAASPLETMVKAALPLAEAEAARTVFWLAGAVLSTVTLAVEAAERLPEESMMKSL